MNNNLPLPAAKVDQALAPIGKRKSLRTTTTTAPYTGQWTRTEAVHLLKRTMFGATKADVDHMLTLTMSQAVDELLNTVTSTPAPPLNNYATAAAPDPNVAFGATWVNDPNVITGTIDAGRQGSITSWWIANMLAQGRSLEQKMTLFWHNHFSTQILVYDDARFAYKYLETLRTNSLGNFQTLVSAVTVDPAMLFYLNGYVNTAAAPDENYARELQELFTQGKGPNSLFTESDVKAAARVLTGWRINGGAVSSYYDSTYHDTNPKQFSAYYNNTVINDTSNAGANEVGELITMLMATNECAEYICRCLYRFFVYYDIDSTVETNVIGPLATAFRNSNYDIKTVLSLLLKSEHFFDTLNQGCLIKPPIDYIVGTLRQLGVLFPGPSDLATQYYMWLYMGYFGSLIGQYILNPPNVAGWPAYYQAPEYHELWINSSSLPLRQEFCDALIYVGVTKNASTVIFDPLAFTASMPTPDDPVALTADVLSYLLSMPVSSTVQSYLQSILLSGQTSTSYWTSAWDAYVASPTTLSLQTTVLNRLKPFYQYIMDLPEFQLQ